MELCGEGDQKLSIEVVRTIFVGTFGVMASEQEFAAQQQFGPCPLLTVLRRRLPIDRARSGHDAAPAAGSFEQPLTRSFPILRPTAALLVGAGFLVVWLPPGALVFTSFWHAAGMAGVR